MDTSLLLPDSAASHETVARRFFRRAFAIFITFSILLTLILFGEALWRTQENLKSELSIYQRTFEKALAAALWSMDHEKLVSITNGIVEIPDIKGVRILDPQDDALILQAGVLPVGDANVRNTLVLRFDVIQDEGFGRELVGRAEFHSSFVQVLERARGQMVLIVVLAMLKTLAFWWIFLHVGQRLLGRPLTEMTRSIAASHAAHPMRLSTATQNAIANTELALLRDAHDEMVTRIDLAHSELRRANEDLEVRVTKRTNELGGIIDSAMDAIIMVDAAQQIVLFNPAAERMFGYRAVERLGGPFAALVPQRFRRLQIEHLRTFDATGTPRRMAALEGVMTIGVRSDGEEFAIEASISCFEANGEQYFTFTLRDVTERRQVQAALRASEDRERARSEELSKLLDAVPAAVWIAHDPQATRITGNRLSDEWLQVPEGTNISAFAPAVERQGNVGMVKDGVVLAPAQMPMHRAAAGVELRDYEFDLIYPDRRRHMLGNATPLQDENGQPRGAIAVFVDITARRCAEMALRAAKAEAERANAAKSRFLAAASHDLRQPLAALGLYVDALHQELGHPDHARLLSSMNDCVSSLSELLTDLLDLSKLDAGVIKPERSDFAIRGVVRRVLSTQAPYADFKGLRLNNACPDVLVHSDPVLLERLIRNMVANAVRYTERGGIVIGCRRHHGTMWLEVWDTGIGIPADMIDEIFEEFKQVGRREGEGSGLGLAIVARTADLLGLKIRVKSRLGKGSMFAIELPLGQSIRETVQDEAVSRFLRIALVDDNPHVLQALEYALQAVGHQVVAASTKSNLMVRLDGAAPDIVISDYRLADGETGFDVIDAVRARFDDALPAVLVTGDTEPEVLRSVLGRGIVVLHKPLELQALRRHMGRLTERRSAGALVSLP